MAEVLSLHNAVEGGSDSGYCAAPDCWWFYEPNGDLPELIAAHQAGVLAANGYGKLEEAWDSCNATDTPWINPYRSAK